MRVTFTIVLMLGSLCAMAQPGSMERPLHVVVTLDHGLVRDGRAQYMVITPGNDTLTAEDLRPATGDSVLSFMVNTSNDDRPWSIRYNPGGAMMNVYLNYDPLLLGLTLRLPFTQGKFELDMDRIMKCLADQAEDLQRRDAQRPGWNLEHPFGAVDTLACRGGLLAYSRGGGMHAEIRILDMLTFVKRALQMPPTAAREASYPGGMSNFNSFIRARFSKPLIERTNLPTGL